jgi:hypothetical protein
MASARWSVRLQEEEEEAVARRLVTSAKDRDNRKLTEKVDRK